MSKETLVCILGFVVFFTPFLGIPGSYKKWLLIGCGIILMLIGYAQRRNAFLRSFERTHGERRSEVFVEHVGVQNQVPAHNDSSIL